MSRGMNLIGAQKSWPCGALLIGRNVVIAQKVVGVSRCAQYLAEELMGEQEEQ